MEGVRHNDYCYHETRHVTIDAGLPIDLLVYHDWFKIEQGQLHVFGDREGYTGYAFDGCSPKWIWLDLIWGTPDGRFVNGRPITYYASLAHDILYQFHHIHGVSRKVCDLVFLRLLQQTNFALRWPYYMMVRLFGGFWWRNHAAADEKRNACVSE